MRNSVTILFLFISLSVFINGEKEFFKVPLEIRKSNRPDRLIDNANDQEMMKMKNIQDKFFEIVSNSSLGQEFKSFNQLLHLLDSQAGLELGRLAVNGFMIGVGNDNSAQLFNEFIDDFQYRLSPDLADALVDYKDFLKTVDLKLLPLTIQTLFKKDALGNSLAQLPLGQLVDIIQPEASKYGIDIRSMVNGIIGKGDKTFPELVKKIMKNFNVSNILKGLGGSVMDENLSKDVGSSKNVPKKDSPLMLFKPIIAKLLKDYDIELDTDAVIQVLTPFVSGWGTMLQNMFASNDGKGGGFNMALLAPLLGLLTSQGNTDKKDGINMMQAAMSLMGNVADKNGDLAPLLNLASQVFGGQKSNTPQTSKSNKKSEDLDLSGIAGIIENLSNEGSGIDMSNLMQMASSLMGNKKDGQGIDADAMLQMASTLMGDKNGDGPDALKLLKLASNLVGSFTKDKEEKTKKLNGIFDALAPFLIKMQKDKKCESKIRDAVAFAKLALGPNLLSLEDIKKTLPGLISANVKEGMPYENIDTDTIITALSFSLEDWSLLIKELADDDFRALLVQNAVIPASDLVEMIASDDFQTRQNAKFSEKLSESLAMIGISGDRLTIPDILDKLKPAIDMMSAGWSLPVKMTSLIDPLKRSWIETSKWYFASVKDFQHMSRSELESLVAQTLENDFALTILDVAKIALASETSSHCIAREVCDLVNDVAHSHPDSVKLLVTKIGSIVYGAIRSEVEGNYNTIIDVMKAVSIGGQSNKCEKYFPIVCPTAVPSSKDGESQPDEKTQSMHEEL